MSGIEFTGILYREGKQVIAECPELDISSFGKNFDEARDNLIEAVALYIETAKELGSWPKISKKLQKRGDTVFLPISSHVRAVSAA